MSTLQLTVPFQKTGKKKLKIRPRELGDWLEDLPYLDIRRASRSASEQLRVMNRQAIAPSLRLMMLENFLGAWQRLNDSLPTNPAEANAIRPTLNRMCQDASFGYKIIVDELVNRRSGFIDLRHLPQALLGAIYTLGLQQLNYYENHKRIPTALWKECMDLCLYAREHGRDSYRGQLPGIGVVQIDECFKLVALIRLADPYSLPAGLTGPLEHYFRRHIQLASLQTTPVPVDDDAEHVVLGLRHPGEDADRIQLYLDITDLCRQLEVDVERLRTGCRPSDIGLPVAMLSSTLHHTLGQILERWRKQAARKDERIPVHSGIELVAGLEATWCMLNRGRCFDPSMFLDAGSENEIDLGTMPAAAPAARRTAPEPLRCNCINRSSGGLAVEYRGCSKLSSPPQAGQLLGVHRPGARTGSGWIVGVCRWLVETANSEGFDLGLQYIARQPRAVVVRTGDGRAQHQPAIAARQIRGSTPVETLIVATGLLKTGAEFVLYEHAEPKTVRCTELLESSAGFERYLCTTV